MGLLLCARCERHVRGDDEKCPFCGATQRQAPAKRKPRLSRAGMIGAAAVAMACSSGTPQDDAGTQDSGPDTMQAAYGGPPMEAGSDVQQQQDAAPDGPVAAYGGPPVDAGDG